MDIFRNERDELERENWAIALGRVPMGPGRPRDDDEDDDDDDDDDLDEE